VITDLHYPDMPDDKPYMSWFSTKEAPVPHVWWRFSPGIFVRFAEVLGFTESRVSFSEQVYVADGPPRSGSLFTVVSTRDPASSTT
jgi:hypothetical protein